MMHYIKYLSNDLNSQFSIQVWILGHNSNFRKSNFNLILRLRSRYVSCQNIFYALTCHCSGLQTNLILSHLRSEACTQSSSEEVRVSEVEVEDI